MDGPDSDWEHAVEVFAELISRSRRGSKEAFIAWVRSADEELMVSGAMLLEYAKSAPVEVSVRMGVAKNF